MIRTLSVDVIQELLPGLDVYLRVTLAGEDLSSLADKNRKYFVNLIDFFRSTHNSKYFPSRNGASSRDPVRGYDLGDAVDEASRDVTAQPGSTGTPVSTCPPVSTGPPVRAEDQCARESSSRPNSAGRVPPPVYPKPVKHPHHSQRTRSRTLGIFDVLENGVADAGVSLYRESSLPLSEQNPLVSKRSVYRDYRSTSPCTDGGGTKVGPPVAPKPCVACRRCCCRSRSNRAVDDVVASDASCQARVETTDATTSTGDVLFGDVADNLTAIGNILNNNNNCVSLKHYTSSTDATNQTDLSFDELETLIDGFINANFEARTVNIGRIVQGAKRTNITCELCGETLRSNRELGSSPHTTPEVPETGDKLPAVIHDLPPDCTESESDDDSDNPFQVVFVKNQKDVATSPKLITDVDVSNDVDVEGKNDVVSDTDADEFGYQVIDYLKTPEGGANSSYGAVKVEKSRSPENEYTGTPRTSYKKPSIVSQELELPPALPERPPFLKCGRHSDVGLPGGATSATSRPDETPPISASAASANVYAEKTYTPPPLPPRKIAPPIASKNDVTHILSALQGGSAAAPLAREENGAISCDYDLANHKEAFVSRAFDSPPSTKMFKKAAVDSESDYTSYESYDDEQSQNEAGSTSYVQNKADVRRSSEGRAGGRKDDVPSPHHSSSNSPEEAQKKSPGSLSLPRLHTFRYSHRKYTLNKSATYSSMTGSLPRPGDEHSAHARQVFGVSGELYHRGKLRRWTKRHCIIHDGKFLCYKNDRESKPMLSFALANFDLAYVEKEAKRSHVIRLSHPGYDTYLFSTDSKQSADRWIEELSIASGQVPGDHTRWSNASNDSTSYDDYRDERLVSSNSLSSNLSQTSNHSDGDPTSTVHMATIEKVLPDVPERVQLSPHFRRRQNYRRLSSPASQNVISRATPIRPAAPTPTREAPGLTGTPEHPKRKFGVYSGTDVARSPAASSPPKRRSMLFGSWARRKKYSSVGLELSSPMNLEVYEGANLAVTLSGSVNVKTSLGLSSDWSRRYCQVKDGFYECYRDIMSVQPEFRFPLIGCSVIEGKEETRPLAFKIIQGDSVKIMMEASDIFDQGRWLNVLIRETCMTTLPADFSDGDHDNGSAHSNDSHDIVATPQNDRARRSSNGDLRRSLRSRSDSSSDSDGYEKQGTVKRDLSRYNPYYDYVRNPLQVLSLDDGYAQIHVPSEGSGKEHFSDSEVVVRPKLRDIYAVVQKRKSSRKSSAVRDGEDEIMAAVMSISRRFGDKTYAPTSRCLKRWSVEHGNGNHGDGNHGHNRRLHDNSVNVTRTSEDVTALVVGDDVRSGWCEVGLLQPELFDGAAQFHEARLSNKDVDSETYYAEDVKRRPPTADELNRSVCSEIDATSGPDEPGRPEVLEPAASLSPTNSGSKKDAVIVEKRGDGCVQILVTSPGSRSPRPCETGALVRRRSKETSSDFAKCTTTAQGRVTIIDGNYSDVNGDDDSLSDHEYEDVGLPVNLLVSVENIYQEIAEEVAPPVPPRIPVSRSPSPASLDHDADAQAATTSAQPTTLPSREPTLPRLTSSSSRASFSSLTSSASSSLVPPPTSRHSETRRAADVAATLSRDDCCDSSFYDQQVGDESRSQLSGSDENFYDPIDLTAHASVATPDDEEETIYEAYSDHEHELLEANKRLFDEQRELVKELKRSIAKLKKLRLAAENRLKFTRDPAARQRHAADYAKYDQQVTSQEFDLDFADRKLRSLALMCRMDTGPRRHRRTNSHSSTHSLGW